MEENETEIETAEREFYEETGYKLKHQLNEKSEKYVIRNNIYFIVKLHSEDDLLQETKIIPDQKEIEKSHWFGINELLSMNLSKFNFGLKTWILNKKYNSL
jgi:8-oxo-dGTP pyrophosphatase MutT (NUDIX family)